MISDGLQVVHDLGHCSPACNPQSPGWISLRAGFLTASGQNLMALDTGRACRPGQPAAVLVRRPAEVLRLGPGDPIIAVVLLYVEQQRVGAAGAW